MHLLIYCINYSTQRNATSSPFFRLPLEIRERIYSHLLGDQLIHLYYDDRKAKPNHGVPAFNHLDVCQLWRHLVCETDGPDDETDTEKLFYGEEGVGCPHNLCRILVNHRVCSCTKCCHEYKVLEAAQSDGKIAPQMCLSILRVCRQIYVEARQIPWSANTFSFSDPRTFRVFMEGTAPGGGLIAWQKRAWKSLRLDINAEDAYDGWNDALKLSFFKELTGLRRLRLRIVHTMTVDAYTTAKAAPFTNTPSHRVKVQGFGYTIGLKRLSIVPWTDVRVVVRGEDFEKCVFMLSGDDRSVTWTKNDE